MKGLNIQMIIQCSNRQSKYLIEPSRSVIHSALEQAEQTVLRFSGLDHKMPWQGDVDAEPQVSVFLTGPRNMRRINRETRGVDQITDVLSFPLIHMLDGKILQPLGPQDYELSKSKLLPLGDLLICLDQANRQAQNYGHSFEREVAFLAVHGFLHLLGFDHDNPQREEKMRDLQSRILDTIGLDRSKENRRKK